MLTHLYYLMLVTENTEKMSNFIIVILHLGFYSHKVTEFFGTGKQIFLVWPWYSNFELALFRKPYSTDRNESAQVQDAVGQPGLIG